MASAGSIRRDDSFVDAQGVRIHYSVWERPDAKAVIQLAHGLGEYALRYERLAGALVAAGYSVWADDHRGHGRTGMEQWGDDRSKLGRLGPGGHRAAVEAVHAFGRIAKASSPELPFVLLGHSWGQIIGQILLNMYPEEYDAAVFTGAAYRTPRYMDSGDLNRKHATAGGSGYEWLSRDPAVVAAAVEDPLMFRATALRLFGVVDGLRTLGRPRRHLAHDVPVLILAGSDDTLGGEASVAKLAQAYRERSGLSDVTAIVYRGARHEVFNETNRDEVTADLIAWLDDRVGDRP